MTQTPTGTCDIVERPMTDEEFSEMNRGFADHGLRFGNEPEAEVRFGFVATDAGVFVGCSSCLVYKRRSGYGTWCFLTDLFVVESRRGGGVGATLLTMLEARVRELGVKVLYTWTAGYEAPGFYRNRGYDVFASLESWYPSGHARIGFKKIL